MRLFHYRYLFCFLVHRRLTIRFILWVVGLSYIHWLVQQRVAAVKSRSTRRRHWTSTNVRARILVQNCHEASISWRLGSFNHLVSRLYRGLILRRNLDWDGGASPSLLLCPVRRSVLIRADNGTAHRILGFRTETIGERVWVLARYHFSFTQICTYWKLFRMHGWHVIKIIPFY